MVVLRPTLLRMLVCAKSRGGVICFKLGEGEAKSFDRMYRARMGLEGDCASRAVFELLDGPRPLPRRDLVEARMCY